MSKCARCGGEVPEPDLKEALARESDWRREFGEDNERVLVCIPCADEIEDEDERM